MAIYRIADLNIKINNRYRYTSRICSNYRLDNQEVTPDFEITVSQEEIDNEKEFLPEFPDHYIESNCIYRKIAAKILDYNGIIMHACVVEKDGKAFAFSAPSGTGKSTHARLWIETFDDAKIINGDKPLLRLIDGTLYAYGTPWCGKEALNINTKCRLDSICFLSQSESNSIEKIDKTTALTKIFTQLLMPDNETQTDSFFSMIETIFDKVKFYSLKCNMQKDAAVVAYEGMKE